ncbi:MAG: hypothetical protein IIZ09_12800 [Ruminococcus sp.]|nr:hypothetical protein [Ruminococcus sp.]
MADKKKINIENMKIDEDDYEYEKKLAEQERERQRLLEEKAAQRRAEAKKRKRDAEKQREEQIRQEKLELLKLKSGIEDEEDSSFTKSEEVIEKPTGMAAVSNFWYHYKTIVIVCSVICAMVGYAVYTQVTRKRDDLTIILTSTCGLEEKGEELEKFFEKYTDDVDGNGYVHVGIIDVPMNPIMDENMQNTYMQKLSAQLQIGEGMIMITDSYTKPECVELLKDDLEKDFPGNKYIDEKGFSFDSKVMAEELDFDMLPNDVHMSIRKPIETMSLDADEAQELYDRSYVVFERIVNDITQKCEETNDPGLEMGPVQYVTDSSAEMTMQ